MNFQTATTRSIDQMAARIGHDCTAIRDYLANKQAMRQAIASQAGTNVEQTKACLLATLYEAPASLSDARFGWGRGPLRLRGFERRRLPATLTTLTSRRLV